MKNILLFTHRKPRRVSKGQWYWALGHCEGYHQRDAIEVYKIMERDDFIDREHFQSGNYFVTQPEASEERERIYRDRANEKARILYHQRKANQTPT